MAAAGCHSEDCTQRTVASLTDHLLSVAKSSGCHGVVLGAYPDPAVGQCWLPDLTEVADTAAFVGMVGPSLPSCDPQRVRFATATPATSAAGSETALAVVCPDTTVALCAHAASHGGTDVVLTHDQNLVHAVARILMWQVDAANALDPPP